MDRDKQTQSTRYSCPSTQQNMIGGEFLEICSCTIDFDHPYHIHGTVRSSPSPSMAEMRQGKLIFQ